MYDLRPLNFGIDASSARRGKKKLVYCMIIGIQEYIILFTQSPLATPVLADRMIWKENCFFNV